MTRQILWEPTALDAAFGHLKDSPSGVDALLRAVDQLADDRRPEGSRPWGTEHRRLRYGSWRVLYRTDPDARTLHVEHVGRTAT